MRRGIQCRWHFFLLNELSCDEASSAVLCQSRLSLAARCPFTRAARGFARVTSTATRGPPLAGSKLRHTCGLTTLVHQSHDALCREKNGERIATHVDGRLPFECGGPGRAVRRESGQRPTRGIDRRREGHIDCVLVHEDQRCLVVTGAGRCSERGNMDPLFAGAMWCRSERSPDE